MYTSFPLLRGNSVINHPPYFENILRTTQQLIETKMFRTSTTFFWSSEFFILFWGICGVVKFTISNFSLFLFASWVVIEINSVEVVVAYVAQVVMGMEKVTWVGF